MRIKYVAISVKQLHDDIIKPSLTMVDMYSANAATLMLGTAATESNMGTYLHQQGEGPALGIYQMEPATYRDIMGRYLASRRSLKEKILAACYYSAAPPVEAVLHNLRFATIMARLKYWPVKEPMPDTIEGQAHYYKTYYNTATGKGSVEKYLKDYNNYIRTFAEKEILQ